jgi:hypothetical protein
MKRSSTMLPVALSFLALTGCVEDKAALLLASSDRNERIEAVRTAQNQYGASPAPDQPAAAAGKEAAGKNRIKPLPINGRWMIKVTLGEHSTEVEVTIRGGELKIPGVDTYWKNIAQVPKSPARYSAVRVGPGILWGTREDPVEFYLDADGILHHDDTQLAPLLRSLGIITLRRP